MAKTKKAGLQRTKRKPAPTPRRTPNPFPWMNRYYVGSQVIADKINAGHNSDWTHQAMKDAVEDAKGKMEDDPSIQLMTIVKIVKIIRRTMPPVEEVDLP